MRSGASTCTHKKGAKVSKQIVGHFTEFAGRRIANRRKAKKIAPEDLAHKVGVSVSVLDNMEHGYCHINLEQLMLFVRYLAPINELLGLPHYSDEEMIAFLDTRIKAMSEEELRGWKAEPDAVVNERRRLFVIELDDEVK